MQNITTVKKKVKTNVYETCSRPTTAILVLMYGKACDVVNIVLRLYCSLSSPCARPSFVNGVSYMNRSAKTKFPDDELNAYINNDICGVC
jgi:hypothetical protein